VELIAREKAGIIKPGALAVTSCQEPGAMAVIEEACRERGVRLVRVGEELHWRRGPTTLEGQNFEVEGRLGSYSLWMPLLGDYQLENAATAVGALELFSERGFPISTEAMARGFGRVEWPCRMEVLRLRPLVVADGAHNPYSAAKLRDSLPLYFQYRGVILVVGASADKNLEGIIRELAPLKPRVIATRSRHPRAATTQALARVFSGYGLQAREVEVVGDAVTLALEEAREGDLVLVTGSLFVAAEAREALKGIAPELYPEFQRYPTIATM
jgi:dihydrofolate synthase/folylpolyglutamate synthase